MQYGHLDHTGPNSPRATAIPGRDSQDMFKILYNITACLFCFLGSAGGCRSAPHTFIRTCSPQSTLRPPRLLPPFLTSLLYKSHVYRRVSITGPPPPHSLCRAPRRGHPRTAPVPRSYPWCSSCLIAAIHIIARFFSSSNSRKGCEEEVVISVGSTWSVTMENAILL